MQRTEQIDLAVVRARLFNPALELYSVAWHLDGVRELAQRGPLRIGYLHLPFLEVAEELSGWARADALHRDVLDALREWSVANAPDALISIDGAHADHLLLLLPDDPGAPAAEPWCRALERAVEGTLTRRHPGHGFVLCAGMEVVADWSDMRFERTFARGVARARSRALATGATAALREGSALDAVLRAGSIRCLYQPIIHIGDESILGYEALSRGPAGTAYEDPETLFEAAAAARLTPALDRLCHQRATAISPERLGTASLFVNASPLTFMSSDFDAGLFCAPFEEAGFKPAQVVIELTERSGVVDFREFGRRLGRLKSRGYRLAIDDVGSGFSSLQTISETGPEFIKIDRGLVSGLHQVPIKREIVKNLVRLGVSTKIRVIAEGVEDLTELNALAKIPVEFAQGHYFARPGEFPG